MYKNLEAEMVRKGITRQDVADLIEVSYNTARNKINGNNQFLLDEAYKVKKEFFPELSFEYLFEKQNQTN